MFRKTWGASPFAVGPSRARSRAPHRGFEILTEQCVELRLFYFKERIRDCCLLFVQVSGLHPFYRIWRETPSRRQRSQRGSLRSTLRVAIFEGDCSHHRRNCVASIWLLCLCGGLLAPSSAIRRNCIARILKEIARTIFDNSVCFALFAERMWGWRPLCTVSIKTYRSASVHFLICICVHLHHCNINVHDLICVYFTKFPKQLVCKGIDRIVLQLFALNNKHHNESMIVVILIINWHCHI